MATPRAAKPCKLFVGLLGGDPDLLRRARQLLTRAWGPVDLVSDLWPFDQTDYYAADMGANLQRSFLGFEKLVLPDELAEVKLDTNALEQQIADDCLSGDIVRPVNIDPGYLTLGKLVLATTKDAAHRVYLGHGIYAEVTLQYAHGAWQGQPWTYPDYRQPVYHDFFRRLRDRLREQQHALGSPPTHEDPPPS